MAVNEALTAYSTTAANNTPAGGDTVGPDLDNHLRDIKKNIRLTAEHQASDTTPEDAQGFIHYEKSASPTHTLRVNDGGAWIPFVEIDVSADRANAIVDGRVATTIFKNLNKTATASVQAAIGVSFGTAVGDAPTLISGSATSIAALPVVSGENLTSTLEEILVALTDETTTQDATASALVTFRMPFAMRLRSANDGVRLSCNAAPSATAVVNVKEGGTSIFGDKPTINPSQTTSLSSGSGSASDLILAEDAEVSWHLDHPGGGTMTGLKGLLRGTRIV